MLTLFSVERDRSIQVREPEDIPDQPSHSHARVQYPYPPLPTTARIQHRHLDIAQILLVQLPFVLDDRANGRTLANRPEFEVRQASLVEITVMFPHAQVVGAPDAHGSIVHQLGRERPADLVEERIPIPDRLETRVEEDISASGCR